MSSEPSPGSVYSQGHAPSVLRSQTWRTVANSAAYLEGELRPGLAVLDVGCGPGTITHDLARRVAPGVVVGVDVEASVLADARRDAPENAVFAVADVTDPASLDAVAAAHGPFDVVHAHQVLLHLADPVAALRAMLRVTRPGGVVAARDTDYGGMTWWPEDPRLDRWLALYRAVGHAHGSEPDAGRRMLGWAHAAGARDVTPGASVWCHATPEERERWGGSWARRIVDSTIAERALAGGFADAAELADIGEGWRAWTAHPDAWFLVPHGEILCRV